MVIKEIELTELIKESIIHALNETNKIRYVSTDEIKRKYNPKQKDVSFDEISREKDEDDLIKAMYPKEKKPSDRRTYGNTSFEQAITDTQRDLTGRMVARRNQAEAKNVTERYLSFLNKSSVDELSPVELQRLNGMLSNLHGGKIRYEDLVGRYKTDENGIEIPLTYDDLSDEEKERKSKLIPNNVSLLKQLNDGGLDLSFKGKTFTYGNKKLPETTMICNVTSSLHCPSCKNNECEFKNVCYSGGANGIENRPEVLYRNLRNEYSFDHISTKDLLRLLDAYIISSNYRIRKIRISEDGDLKTQEQLDYINKIAGHLKAKYGIETTVYTHRNLNFENCENLIINMSSLSLKGGDRYFLARNKEYWKNLKDGIDPEIGTFKCYCDCRKCEFCYKTPEENVVNGISEQEVMERLGRPVNVIEVIRK